MILFNKVNMVICKEEGCNKIASYNFEGEKKAVRCKTHVVGLSMIDVRNKRCISDGCDKVHPVYNYPSEYVGLWCKNCKPDGTVNMECIECIHEGCKERAMYNFEGEKKGVCCFVHQYKSMVHIRNKKKFNKCDKVVLLDKPHEDVKPAKIKDKCDKAILLDELHKNEKPDEIKDQCDKVLLLDKPHEDVKPVKIKDKCDKMILLDKPHKDVKSAIIKDKSDEMVLPDKNTKSIKTKNKCSYVGCDKYPSYNFPDHKTPIRCAAHASNGMYDVKNNRCIFDGCVKLHPSYNYPDKYTGLWCATHRPKETINIEKLKCIHKGCKDKPTHNFSNETIRLYCKNHNKEDMVSVVKCKKKKNVKCNKTPKGKTSVGKKCCDYIGCNKSAIFNFPTKTGGIVCSTHKLPKMVNMVSKRCLHDGCLKRPFFNFPSEKMGIYCGDHYFKGMKNILSKKCIHENCDKRATFNIKGKTNGLYCGIHRDTLTMVSIYSKQCTNDGCNQIATHNFPSETKKIVCLEHIKDGMERISSSKQCRHDGCKNDATHGFKGQRKKFCSEHKKPDTIDQVLESKCSVLNCNKKYDCIVNRKKLCLEHSPEDYEINIKRLCKYCDIKEKSKYICKRCKRIRNKKENGVVEYLKKEIKVDFKHDTCEMLQGCSKRRPDMYYELNKHCVIVEIDENQHRGYGDSCECSRISEIVGGIGGKSVIFIRFNPDPTRNKGNKLNLELGDKIDLLVDTVKKELNKDYDKFQVKLIQLYYNDEHDTYQEMKEEIITDKVCI